MQEPLASIVQLCLMHVSPMYILRGEGKEQTIGWLHKGFLNYTYFMLFRDKMDGSLRGIAAIGIKCYEKYTELKMGPTFFKNYYKGGPISYIAMGRCILKGNSLCLKLAV